MKKKVGVVSLGCPKNLVDSEIMLGLLQDEQYEITNNEKEANIIIVNTCGFIESAKQESINTILEMSVLKDKNCELLVVTGCLSERYKEILFQELPEVDAVVGTGNYGEIADIIRKAYQGEKVVSYGKLDSVDYLRSRRVVSTTKGYAYLKIAEGCDNCCTYCIIPSLRGKYRSRKIDELVDEATNLAESGVKEIILVAQDTTRYGVDIYGSKRLVELIRRISGIGKVEWIRLLYCYPEEIDDNLVNEIAGNPKVCKYIDIPIQHASDNILKAMGRRGRSEETKDLLKKLRQRIPEIVIRTSVIVGFPGEDEDDFHKLCVFIKESKFDRLGVFTYSKEENTAAAKMKHQVRKDLKQKRYETVMELQRDISQEKSKMRLGMEYKVLVEGVAEDGIFYHGRTYAEAPEIDGTIYFTSHEPLSAGEFINIRILNADEYDLIGEVTNESAK